MLTMKIFNHCQINHVMMSIVLEKDDVYPISIWSCRTTPASYLKCALKEVLPSLRNKYCANLLFIPLEETAALLLNLLEPANSYIKVGNIGWRRSLLPWTVPSTTKLCDNIFHSFISTMNGKEHLLFEITNNNLEGELLAHFV